MAGLIIGNSGMRIQLKARHFTRSLRSSGINLSGLKIIQRVMSSTSVIRLSEDLS